MKWILVLLSTVSYHPDISGHDANFSENEGIYSLTVIYDDKKQCEDGLENNYRHITDANGETIYMICFRQDSEDVSFGEFE